MPELGIFILPVRIAQAVLALIILGASAYASHLWSSPSSWSPSQLNFLIFNTIWTLLVLAYLILTPRFFPTAAHKYAILAAEAVTCVFWFAGSVALAVALGHINCTSRWGPCRGATAGDVFGFFEWFLFVFTTVVAALHCLGTRSAPAKAVEPGPAMSIP